MHQLPTVEVNFSDKVKRLALLDTGSSMNAVYQNMLNNFIKNKLIKYIGTKELPCFPANNQD